MNYGFEFKDVLASLLTGSISRYVLFNVAKVLKVNHEPSEDIIKVQRTVQQQLLLHLLREEPENEDYKNLLNETEGWLRLKKESGFHCSITGCFYKGSKHRDYLKHLKSTHFTHRSLLCNFGKKCRQRFPSIVKLEEHMNIHKKKTYAGTDEMIKDAQESSLE